MVGAATSEDAAELAIGLELAGRRVLKGFADPVAVWSVTAT